MKKCYDCGHEHPTMACASRPSDLTFNDGVSKVWEKRFFCHENDHSCYQSRYGNYWDDRRLSTFERVKEMLDEALGRDN